MKTRIISIIAVLITCSLPAGAQDEPESAGNSFEGASASVQQRLEESIAELAALRERIADEKIPLNSELNDLETELVQVRLDYQQTARLLDSRNLDLNNLQTEIKSRRDEAAYLSNLLADYIRNFESRLHIAEINRYEERLETAKLAPENSNISDQDIYEIQAAILGDSLERLHEALGGIRFEGTAVDSAGLVKHGTFAMVGPSAIFRSNDGEAVGTAEQRLGSLEPAQIAFGNPEDSLAAAEVVTTGAGHFPLDPTLGNAHKIEATNETIWEHIKKGGPVMVPIFIMAGAAFLVALFKWIGLAFIRRPSRKKIGALLQAVSRHEVEAARQTAGAIKGPVGRMLAAGVEHINHPRELIEEVMYETVLTTRLKLQRMLPFIAICAASAPLLGLLGTVTGIISTFKLITVFGSGDVKTLSGGISEALITTEFGLIVAIPSLLLHSFLSRKARGIINQMETAAVTFVNQISRAPFERTYSAAPAEAQVAGGIPEFALAADLAPAEAASEPAEAASEPAEAASEPAVESDALKDQIERILEELVPGLIKDHLETTAAETAEAETADEAADKVRVK